MNVIKVRNDFSYLESDDQDLITKLYQSLRFRKPGYFHSRLYKQKKWDGFINFFNQNSGKFLTGLLPEVKLALHTWGREYILDDDRTSVKFAVDKVDANFLKPFPNLKGKPITLNDYQVDLINQTIRFHRGIIKAPTSAGKTYIMIGIMKALPPNLPTLFLVNRKGLVSQNYKEIQGWGFPNVGRWDGDHHDANLITCATAQSAMKLGNLLSKFRALIVDEVHMMMNPTAMKIYKKLTGCSVRIGVSATPFKYGETDLVHKYGVKGYFGPVLLTETTDDGKLTTNFLQERGQLSASKCFFYYVDEPQIPHDIYIDAVTNGIAHNWHFHQMVQRLAKKLTGRTLILVERIAHGDTLNNLIPGSLWVQGKDNEQTRDFVINQLQQATGNVVAIATQGIFSAGINVFLHNLINAAGGKAEHDVVQRMGRGLRTADDKEILHYYDFIFRINDYLEDHSWERIKILKKEKHEVNIMEQVNF